MGAGRSPPTGGLAKLKLLGLSETQITDAGCAALAAALDRGALPALDDFHVCDIPASEAATAALLARFSADSDDNSDEE